MTEVHFIHTRYGVSRTEITGLQEISSSNSSSPEAENDLHDIQVPLLVNPRVSSSEDSSSEEDENDDYINSRINS